MTTPVRPSTDRALNNPVTHTPGPWHTDMHKMQGETFHAVFCKGRSPDGIFIGSVGTQPESAANAKLVAAAPDLLAALIEAREMLREHGWVITSGITAAIKKATA